MTSRVPLDLQSRRLRHTAWAVGLAFLGACASTPVGQPDLLGFIEDGRTTREQAFLALGEPSATYEEGRILTFRLGQDKAGYFLVDKGPGFTSVKYSLVMSFDDAGLLRRHSLVALKAP